MEMNDPTLRSVVAIVDLETNVEESSLPFGKRWRQQRIILTPEHLAALQAGKLLAIDVQEEYVVFVEFAPATMNEERSTR